MHATAIVTDPAVTRRARSAFPGGSMPTEMSTGRPGRQMSTFPPGIRGTRMPTR